MPGRERGSVAPSAAGLRRLAWTEERQRCDVDGCSRLQWRSNGLRSSYQQHCEQDMQRERKRLRPSGGHAFADASKCSASRSK